MRSGAADQRRGEYGAPGIMGMSAPGATVQLSAGPSGLAVRRAVELDIVRAGGGFTVRKQIRYGPEDIVLDLSEPDLGHPDGLEILQRHYRQSERPGMGFSKATPAFVCLTHEGGTNPGLYLRKLDGE